MFKFSTITYFQSLIAICCIVSLFAQSTLPPQTFCQQQFRKCYIALTTLQLHWLEAEQNCMASGRNGHLTSIHSAFENQYVFDVKTNATSSGDYWIGAMNRSNGFAWTDNTRFDYERWAAGFPTTSSTDNCIGVYVQPESAQATWYNDDCNSRKYAVCEYDIGEISKCPLGWTYFSVTNSCYLLVQQPNTSWTVARDMCQQMGVNLVSIHSFEENEFVAHLAYNSSMIIADDLDQIWIGLYSPYQNDTFVWIDGTEFDYSRWHNGEPSGGNEHCVELYSNVNLNWGDPVEWYGKWNDVVCTRGMRSFVCKRPAMMIA